jgi:hypothetical protein
MPWAASCTIAPQTSGHTDRIAPRRECASERAMASELGAEKRAEGPVSALNGARAGEQAGYVRSTEDTMFPAAQTRSQRADIVREKGGPGTKTRQQIVQFGSDCFHVAERDACTGERYELAIDRFVVPVNQSDGIRGSSGRDIAARPDFVEDSLHRRVVRL